MARKTFTAANARRRRPVQDTDTSAPVSPAYWYGLGYETTIDGTVLYVALPGGIRLADHGDYLVRHRDGEPTDDEIAALVAAGKARRWEDIRFSGGSPEFQPPARIEALRQGYRLDQISLECEDGLPKPANTLPMPDHIRRRLIPDPAPDQVPALPPSEPTPAPRLRP
ncbi:LPD7 domain-containing protein [Aliidongia dinghuensis]|uniref:LPD7 domain-containing protein n=1 Tax=Aliidongia dinghuensis TaxID=1867774 RepID=UPI00166CE11E|nr:LPD7 domain-containing protein [Aliidongia dinghuensis]